MEDFKIVDTKEALGKMGYQLQNGGIGKKIQFESLREALGVKGSEYEYNKKIKKTFYFLKGLGLIDFETGCYYNTKGIKIDCFNLKEVNYYINQEEYEWTEDEVMDSDLVKEAKERLAQYDCIFEK